MEFTVVILLLSRCRHPGPSEFKCSLVSLALAHGVLSSCLSRAEKSCLKHLENKLIRASSGSLVALRSQQVVERGWSQARTLCSSISS